MASLKPSAQRVQEALRAMGYDNEVLELSDSTRTAAEAAQTVGCHVGQIAKSLIFRGVETGSPVLVIASGLNRVDESRVAAWLGEPLGKADANFVRDCTGFVIGGVPPVAHATPMKTVIDADLLQYDVIWAAAGHPRALFQLSPTQLVQMTGGHVMAVKAE